MRGEVLRRRCRGRRPRRSARSARRPWAAAPGRAAAPPPAASRRCPTPGSRPSASGRSIEKLATLRDDEQRDLAGAERLEQPLALLDRRLALDHRRVEPLAELVELVEVLPDDQHRLAAVLRRPARSTTSVLWRRAGREPVALLGLGGRVGQPLARRSASPAPRRSRPARCSPAPRCPSTARRSASARSARTRRPRGRPRAPASRSGRAGAGPAGRRSSGRSAPAAGAPRRRRSRPQSRASSSSRCV